ncbi:Putative ribonuclease H protein At1g65750 [Linum perenne]
MISKLQDDRGNWITNKEQLRAMSKNFFENLFKVNSSIDHGMVFEGFPQLVTQEINSELCGSVSEEEIRKAVFALGAGKSPGPDGFSGHFYRKFWGTVGSDLCSEISDFFKSASMKHGWNDTHIAMIPKVPNPTSMSQFRPISCCNFRYKVISKVMATRLKKWIPMLVSEMQAAFTGGRVIQDNVVIVHEVLHQFKIRKKGNQFDMMLKLDMEKAYDLVDWDCLERILAAYGFSPVWISWIRACIRSVRFSILFNGQPTDFFTPSRGIRQGDPISPFLFILVSNALSHLVESNVANSTLNGIRLRCRSPLLTHCLFADDTVVFGKASTTEAQNILNVLSSYGQLTGQEINCDKSSVFFSANTPISIKSDITAVLGFASLACHSKYLGVPTEWGRSRKETFTFLIERMEKQGQAWKGRMLSQSGRETLIKSVIQAIPTYLMSLFYLSATLTKRMDTMVRNFFWSGAMNKRSIHWSGAETLCNPKNEGGLGFRNFSDFNLALLAKQGWRILTNPNALWVRLLKSLYFHNRDFLSAKRGARPSWIWSSIFKARDTVSLGALKILGDGSTIDINNDPWIPTLPKFLTPFNGCPNKFASELINEDPRSWKEDQIQRFFSPIHTRAILAVPIGPSGMEDEWNWSFTRKGLFSVSSAYYAKRKMSQSATPTRGGSDCNKIWKWIWSLSLPPKIKFFIWRVSKDVLATNDNLFKRKCAPNNFCPLCPNVIESSWHCLIMCPHAREVWSSFFPSIPIPTYEMDFTNWFFQIFNGAGETSIRTMAAVTWNIWKSRNEKVFSGTDPNLFATKLKTAQDMEDWKQCCTSAYDGTHPRANLPQYPSTPPHSIPLPPPRIPDLVIHCDGSFVKDSLRAAYGVVMTNSHGQVCDGRSGTFFCSSPIVAEAKAINEAISLAASRQVTTVIRSDCLSLINILNKHQVKWPWECSALIAVMVQSLATCPWVTVEFTPRSDNCLADWVAKSARLERLPVDWMEVLNSSE